MPLAASPSAPEGVVQFLVPAETEGLTATPLESLDLVRRYGELRFDNVELPATAILGAPDSGEADFERLLQIAVALQCAETSGAVAEVFAREGARVVLAELDESTGRRAEADLRRSGADARRSARIFLCSSRPRGRLALQ